MRSRALYQLILVRAMRQEVENLIQAEFIDFPDGGSIPNNPDLPVMLVRAALPEHSAAAICQQFENCGWAGTWTYTVFDYHHYHHDAHEALCVASGWADIVLGGPIVGQSVRLEAGDLVVLPAGTGHCLVDSSDDFSICGCYPPGQSHYTICLLYTSPSPRDKRQSRMPSSA